MSTNSGLSEKAQKAFDEFSDLIGFDLDNSGDIISKSGEAVIASSRSFKRRITLDTNVHQNSDDIRRIANRSAIDRERNDISNYTRRKEVSTISILEIRRARISNNENLRKIPPYLSRTRGYTNRTITTLTDEDFDTLISDSYKPIKISGVKTDYTTIAPVYSQSTTSYQREKPELPKGHEKYKDPYKSDREIDALSKKISKSVKRQTRKEDRKIKREKAKEEKKQKKLHLAKSKGGNPFRYTDPKKRLLTSRLFLASRYNKGYFSDIEYASENGEYTFQEVEESKNATSRRDRRLYKELQEYEDIRDDVKAKRGYKALTCGLAAIALAACIAIPIKSVQYVMNDIASKAEITQTQVVEQLNYETASSEQRQMADKVISSIKENTDYPFSNLSDVQMEDAILRLPGILDRTPVQAFESYAMKFSDQLLLDKLLREAYEYEEDGAKYSKYDTFSLEQKLDLKQLLYEYLGQKEEFSKAISYIRSPEDVEELIEKYNNAPQTGARANPGAVAGYGAAGDWKGEKVKIERNANGSISIIYEDRQEQLDNIDDTVHNNLRNTDDEITRE